MSWAPISLIVPQFVFGEPSAPASGYVLKAYQPGGTTNIPMATDSTGATTFNDISLNSEGYPEHSNSIVIPHIDQAYKLALYATQAAADANTPAVWSSDNLTPVSTSGVFTKNDSNTSSVTDVITLTHTLTGTPAGGTGLAASFVQETSDDNNETVMRLKAVMTDVSAGSEDAKFVVALMTAGTSPTDVFEVTNLGSFNFLKDNPEIVGGDTNGVFTIGANTNALGSVIKMYGDTHATKAGDFEVYTDTTLRASYDLSATKWDFVGILETDSFKFGSGATVTTILDEDDMSSDSATALVTQQSVKAYVDNTASVVSGQKSGLILSNNSTDSDHDIDVTAGGASDSSNTFLLSVSAITKRIDATWASGTGNGGLASGATLANTTWYHVFIVRVGGSDDIMFDTSVTCANGVANNSVTHYRRIGSVLTDGSANIIAFTQKGDEFRFVPVSDVANTSPGTSAVTATLTVPTNVSVLANVSVSVQAGSSSSNPVYVLLTNPDVTDTAPSVTLFTITANVAAGSGLTSGGMANVPTNTSAQIRYRSSTTDTNFVLRITTHGWREFF